MSIANALLDIVGVVLAEHAAIRLPVCERLMGAIAVQLVEPSPVLHKRSASKRVVASENGLKNTGEKQADGKGEGQGAPDEGEGGC